MVGRVSLLNMAGPGSTPNGMRAIDRLKAAANLKPLRKVVVLNNGDEFELWHRPLTMAQRERAQKGAKDDSGNSLALQLLIETALDENGQRLFTAGEISELKHWVRDEDLQKLMLAVISGEAEDEDKGPPTIDMKRTPAATVEG
jgi:hypothetical protein